VNLFHLSGCNFVYLEAALVAQADHVEQANIAHVMVPNVALSTARIAPVSTSHQPSLPSGGRSAHKLHENSSGMSLMSILVARHIRHCVTPSPPTP
jgi:hypothetical protein